ncbi:hypothetical protein EXIGLDRAFT_749490 [Exidia glandulosa HHB12029]|uniref:Fibronectin type-III domain-containing protein n=1 Tax=Exidia glandulosa HHB12029 TaxID=1314781 RepID=A0A165I1I3_EXIGL|nr:hypothetical protein EXIGLDRAFT_749490 [Exidia glandulosa HHB12029]
MGQDSFTFTVGKLDAGMAILIGERAHLIEFPSLLLPPGVTSGSIVNIAVHRNHAEEKRQRNDFWSLQDEILSTFGNELPEPPKLEVRNVTQTSVTLEWPPLKLATAKLRSLDIYRNGQRLASIPAPHQNTSTKLSSLELNTEYSFQLVLKTTAGTFPSNVLRVRTHTINDTSGISVCFGNVEDPELLEAAKESLANMKAKWSDKIQIDTTHFVCTTPAAVPPPGRPMGYLNNPPGVEYQRALQLSIPVVQPHWIIACDNEKKMVPTASYYLGMTVSRPQTSTASKRTSIATSSPTSPSSTSSNQHARGMSAPENHPYPSQAQAKFGSRTPPAPLPESDEEEEEPSEEVLSPRGHARSGTMVRDFKFPPVSPVSPTPAVPPAPIPDVGPADRAHVQRQMSVVAVEVPPPPPVEKERTAVDDDGDDVGETVEVDLS